MGAMSSFSVKNVCRKGIVTHDTFFNTSEEIPNYLALKNSQFSYQHIPPESLAERRDEFVGNKAKGRISKRDLQENKTRQTFRKMNISYPMIRKIT